MAGPLHGFTPSVPTLPAPVSPTAPQWIALALAPWLVLAIGWWLLRRYERRFDPGLPRTGE